MYGQPPITPYYYYNIDSCCNIYWVFFALGITICYPALCCGAFGICADSHNEKLAGKANLIALCIVTVVSILVVVSILNDDNEEEETY